MGNAGLVREDVYDFCTAFGFAVEALDGVCAG